MSGPRVVGIGGGHGLAQTLRAALIYAGSVSAVVTVADDGGSSGRLTRELKVPPPGDIRNCLVALSPDNETTRLFQYRFSSGALEGHAFGNLFIAAAAGASGDFGGAVEQAAQMLGARGMVFPATTSLVSLGAQVEGGAIQGQVAVAQSGAHIHRIFLTPPDPPAYEPAVAAIREADQIVFGPGSLFTSLIATLLVPGIREAVVASRATRVFVCNNREQPGETEGLDARDHLDALVTHLGAKAVDHVLVQSPRIGRSGLDYQVEELEGMGVSVVEANVSGADGGHDPTLLAEALAPLAGSA